MSNNKDYFPEVNHIVWVLIEGVHRLALVTAITRPVFEDNNDDELPLSCNIVINLFSSKGSPELEDRKQFDAPWHRNQYQHAQDRGQPFPRILLCDGSQDQFNHPLLGGHAANAAGVAKYYKMKHKQQQKQQQPQPPPALAPAQDTNLVPVKAPPPPPPPQKKLAAQPQQASVSKTMKEQKQSLDDIPPPALSSSSITTTTASPRYFTTHKKPSELYIRQHHIRMAQATDPKFNPRDDEEVPGHTPDFLMETIRRKLGMHGRRAEKLLFNNQEELELLQWPEEKLETFFDYVSHLEGLHHQNIQRHEDKIIQKQQELMNAEELSRRLATSNNSSSSNQHSAKKKHDDNNNNLPVVNVASLANDTAVYSFLRNDDNKNNNNNQRQQDADSYHSRYGQLSEDLLLSALLNTLSISSERNSFLFLLGMISDMRNDPSRSLLGNSAQSTFTRILFYPALTSADTTHQINSNNSNNNVMINMTNFEHTAPWLQERLLFTKSTTPHQNSSSSSSASSRPLRTNLEYILQQALRNNNSNSNKESNEIRHRTEKLNQKEDMLSFLVSHLKSPGKAEEGKYNNSNNNNNANNSSSSNLLLDDDDDDLLIYGENNNNNNNTNENLEDDIEAIQSSRFTKAGDLCSFQVCKLAVSNLFHDHFEGMREILISNSGGQQQQQLCFSVFSDTFQFFLLASPILALRDSLSFNTFFFHFVAPLIERSLHDFKTRFVFNNNSGRTWTNNNQTNVSDEQAELSKRMFETIHELANTFFFTVSCVCALALKKIVKEGSSGYTYSPACLLRLFRVCVDVGRCLCVNSEDELQVGSLLGSNASHKNFRHSSTAKQNDNNADDNNNNEDAAENTTNNFSGRQRKCRDSAELKEMNSLQSFSDAAGSILALLSICLKKKEKKQPNEENDNETSSSSSSTKDFLKTGFERYVFDQTDKITFMESAFGNFFDVNKDKNKNHSDVNPLENFLFFIPYLDEDPLMMNDEDEMMSTMNNKNNRNQQNDDDDANNINNIAKNEQEKEFIRLLIHHNNSDPHNRDQQQQQQAYHQDRLRFWRETVKIAEAKGLPHANPKAPIQQSLNQIRYDVLPVGRVAMMICNSIIISNCAFFDENNNNNNNNNNAVDLPATMFMANLIDELTYPSAFPLNDEYDLPVSSQQEQLRKILSHCETKHYRHHFALTKRKYLESQLSPGDYFVGPGSTAVRKPTSTSTNSNSASSAIGGPSSSSSASPSILSRLSWDAHRYLANWFCQTEALCVLVFAQNPQQQVQVTSLFSRTLLTVAHLCLSIPVFWNCSIGLHPSVSTRSLVSPLASFVSFLDTSKVFFDKIFLNMLKPETARRLDKMPADLNVKYWAEILALSPIVLCRCSLAVFLAQIPLKYVLLLTVDRSDRALMSLMKKKKSTSETSNDNASAFFLNDLVLSWIDNNNNNSSSSTSSNAMSMTPSSLLSQQSEDSSTTTLKGQGISALSILMENPALPVDVPQSVVNMSRVCSYWDTIKTRTHGCETQQTQRVSSSNQQNQQQQQASNPQQQPPQVIKTILDLGEERSRFLLRPGTIAAHFLLDLARCSAPLNTLLSNLSSENAIKFKSLVSSIANASTYHQLMASTAPPQNLPVSRTAPVYDVLMMPIGRKIAASSIQASSKLCSAFSSSNRQNGYFMNASNGHAASFYSFSASSSVTSSDVQDFLGFFSFDPTPPTTSSTLKGSIDRTIDGNIFPFDLAFHSLRYLHDWKSEFAKDVLSFSILENNSKSNNNSSKSADATITSSSSPAFAKFQLISARFYLDQILFPRLLLSPSFGASSSSSSSSSTILTTTDSEDTHNSLIVPIPASLRQHLRKSALENIRKTLEACALKLLTDQQCPHRPTQNAIIFFNRKIQGLLAPFWIDAANMPNSTAAESNYFNIVNRGIAECIASFTLIPSKSLLFLFIHSKKARPYIPDERIRCALLCGHCSAFSQREGEKLFSNNSSNGSPAKYSKHLLTYIENISGQKNRKMLLKKCDDQIVGIFQSENTVKHPRCTWLSQLIRNKNLLNANLIEQVDLEGAAADNNSNSSSRLPQQQQQQQRLSSNSSKPQPKVSPSDSSTSNQNRNVMRPKLMASSDDDDDDDANNRNKNKNKTSNNNNSSTTRQQTYLDEVEAGMNQFEMTQDQQQSSGTTTKYNVYSALLNPDAAAAAGGAKKPKMKKAPAAKNAALHQDAATSDNTDSSSKQPTLDAFFDKNNKNSHQTAAVIKKEPSSSNSNYGDKQKNNHDEHEVVDLTSSQDSSSGSIKLIGTSSTNNTTINRPLPSNTNTTSTNAPLFLQPAALSSAHMTKPDALLTLNRSGKPPTIHQDAAPKVMMMNINNNNNNNNTKSSSAAAASSSKSKLIQEQNQQLAQQNLLDSHADYERDQLHSKLDKQFLELEIEMTTTVLDVPFDTILSIVSSNSGSNKARSSSSQSQSTTSGSSHISDEADSSRSTRHRLQSAAAFSANDISRMKMKLTKTSSPEEAEKELMTSMMGDTSSNNINNNRNSNINNNCYANYHDPLRYSLSFGIGLLIEMRTQVIQAVYEYHAGANNKKSNTGTGRYKQEQHSQFTGTVNDNFSQHIVNLVGKMRPNKFGGNTVTFQFHSDFESANSTNANINNANNNNRDGFLPRHLQVYDFLLIEFTSFIDEDFEDNPRSKQNLLQQIENARMNSNNNSNSSSPNASQQQSYPRSSSSATTSSSSFNRPVLVEGQECYRLQTVGLVQQPSGSTSQSTAQTFLSTDAARNNNMLRSAGGSKTVEVALAASQIITASFLNKYPGRAVGSSEKSVSALFFPQRGKITVTKLGSVNSFMQQLVALHEIPKNPRFWQVVSLSPSPKNNSILRSSANNHFNSPFNRDQIDIARMTADKILAAAQIELNESQRAVANQVFANNFAPYCRHQLSSSSSTVPSTIFCEGPPGTGKSLLIVSLALKWSLMARILKRELSLLSGIGNQQSSPILICAPSNAAVDEIVNRLKDRKRLSRFLGVGLKQNNNNDDDDQQQQQQQLTRFDSPLNIVRVGVESSINQDVINDKLFIEDQIQEKLQSQRNNNNGTAGVKSWNNQTSYFDIRQEILDQADIVCATLGSIKNWLPKNFSFVIIDEASQAIEPNVIVPLALCGAQRAVVVGDPKQLRPLVLSEERVLMKSLMERFFDHIYMIRRRRREDEQNNTSTAPAIVTPSLTLKMQYRMHPVISKFSNTMFYRGEIQDALDVVTDKYSNGNNNNINLARIARPFSKSNGVHLPHNLIFMDVKGIESMSSTGSIYNETEAACVLYALRGLFSGPLRGNQDLLKQITIITFYLAQKKYLRTKLPHDFYSAGAGQVSTVDSFQGQESSGIILSLVRAASKRASSSQSSVDQVNNSTVGFLDNDNRLNVALTRAKDLLVIFGDADHVSQYSQTLKRLVEYCREGSTQTTNIAFWTSEKVQRELSRCMEVEKDIRVDMKFTRAGFYFGNVEKI